METFEDPKSDRTVEYIEDVETGVGKWHCELSDEEWEKLEEYLSQTEEGKQRLQVYEHARETGQIPSCIDADQWESQWHEDLWQAGISDRPSVE